MPDSVCRSVEQWVEKEGVIEIKFYNEKTRFHFPCSIWLAGVEDKVKDKVKNKNDDKHSNENENMKQTMDNQPNQLSSTLKKWMMKIHMARMMTQDKNQRMPKLNK